MIYSEQKTELIVVFFKVRQLKITPEQKYNAIKKYCERFLPEFKNRDLIALDKELKDANQKISLNLNMVKIL